MAVERIGEIYSCKVCGNKVQVVKVGGGTLVCCNQDMVKEVEAREDIRTATTHLP